MGLNRLMLVKKTAVSGGDNVFIMTMRQKSSQYGYSRNNGNYGEVTSV